MKQAERIRIKAIQEQTFPDELKYLKGSKKSPKQIVTQLSLYLDEHGIIRCEGRIQHSSHQDVTKQPILLPSKHWYTDLLIERHRTMHHDGIRETVNCIREDYWILRARESVKRVLKKCVVCKRMEGKPFATPKIPQLQPERVCEEPPFTNTGIDFAGPLYVKLSSQSGSKDSEKVYIAPFTCPSARAVHVHLKLVENLSVPTFFPAFRRFTSRRGLPSSIFTDNAKTFKAASRKITSIYTSK